MQDALMHKKFEFITKERTSHHLKLPTFFVPLFLDFALSHVESLIIFKSFIVQCCFVLYLVRSSDQ